MIRVLIVDDEPIIRRSLRGHLARRDGYKIVGECCSGYAAVESIRDLKPGLVFLDLQMPELDGFGVVREIGADEMPPVVFVTAFDEYAVTALDVNALDYLLKPFDGEQFARCLARVEQQLCRADKTAFVEKLESLLAGRHQPQTGDRLAIRNSDRITLLHTHEIAWIEAADNYVQIHVGQHVHLMRETLTNLQQRLQSHHFLRVHRSKLVNTDH